MRERGERGGRAGEQQQKTRALRRHRASVRHARLLDSLFASKAVQRLLASERTSMSAGAAKCLPTAAPFAGMGARPSVGLNFHLQSAPLPSPTFSCLPQANGGMGPVTSTDQFSEAMKNDLLRSVMAAAAAEPGIPKLNCNWHGAAMQFSAQ